MRGFLSGVIWGGVTIGVGLAALSLMTPVAPRPDLASQAPEGRSVAPEPGVEAQVPQARDPDLAEAAPSVLQSGEARSDGNPPETTSAKAPEVAGAPEGPEVPEVTQERAEAAEPGAERAATAAAPRPEAPQDPGSDAAPVAAAQVEAAQPQVESSPEVPGVAEAGVAPVAPEGGEAPERVAGLPALRPESEAEAAPVVPAAPQPAPQGGDAPQALDEGAEVEAEPTAPQPAPAPPQVAEAPEAIAEPEGEDSPAVLPAAAQEPPKREAEPPQETAPKTAALPQAGSDEDGLRPRIGQRVVPLTERGKAEPEADVAEAQAAPDGPPLERYAAQAENPEGKPLMAIVLIDDAGAIGHEALAEFPYPLTFAIDPTAPDAAEKMARHRDAGFEVVALFDLPREGRPQDAEVALSAGFDRLPEALAVMEGTGTGVQGNRKMSDQVAAFAGSTGRGLITLGNGLNTMQKLALREGVPAVPVFRDFDGAGQTPTVMRRFLDQAAFRAGQEGAVIMLGRVRPDTVSSLLIWALQDRVNRVAMVPVSAVLKASVAGE